jgi:hypothetical protein
MIQQQQTAADETRAALIESYLNYTPNEMPGGGLATQAQSAITEALIKGRGLLWTLPHRPPGAEHLLIVSEYDSVDNLYIDPDATSLEDAMWVARKCVHPVWQVESDYNLPPDSLKDKASAESATHQGLTSQDDGMANSRAAGKSNDLITYYKIYSKMGVGGRLCGMKDDFAGKIDGILGDYAYIVVAPGIPYPLNMPDELLTTGTDEDISEAFSWPIPYYADERWPFTALDFYREPGNPWPIAPLKPGLGELKFINVMVSALANRIWTSSRDFIKVWKGCSEKIKACIENGEDMSFLEVDSSEADAVSFLTQPQVNGDVWQILDAMMQIFDKRVGLNELLYGISQRQDRSATESQMKNDRASTRVDDMAEKVEKWLTEAARREGFCARWFIEPQDIELSMGPVAAGLWQQLVMTDDIERVVREFEYRVEASSARKPNLDKRASDVGQVMPMLLPFYQQMASMGNVDPFNALINEWGKSVQMDTSRMLIAPPPPPPEMPMDPSQMPPEQQGPMQ